jgi:uncharacterized protein
MSGSLQAPLQVEFDYTRSLGPVLSRFMTGLRDQTIFGSRASDGRVIVPPVEYDPVTHEATTDFVEVGQAGIVQTWSWVSRPVRDQPFDRPFAFALVLLDGADAPMLHAVDVESPDAMRTGMRVKVRWADETVGHISDIKCFEPVTDPASGVGVAEEVGPDEASSLARSSLGGQSHPRLVRPHLSAHTTANAGSVEPDSISGIVTPVRLGYTYAASKEESRFYRGIAEGKILGQRCPTCEKVYVPPRGACPVDGVPTTDEIELPDHGIVTTYCIVNVPFLGQRIKPPYVSAYVLLEGADIAFLHLILGCEPDEVRMGMRVEAVWRPREEWGTTIENIDHFTPTGEPDAPYESFANHL